MFHRAPRAVPDSDDDIHLGEAWEDVPNNLAQGLRQFGFDMEARHVDRLAQRFDHEQLGRDLARFIAESMSGDFIEFEVYEVSEERPGYTPLLHADHQPLTTWHSEVGVRQIIQVATEVDQGDRMCPHRTCGGA